MALGLLGIKKIEFVRLLDFRKKNPKRWVYIIFKNEKIN